MLAHWVMTVVVGVKGLIFGTLGPNTQLRFVCGKWARHNQLDKSHMTYNGTQPVPRRETSSLQLLIGGLKRDSMRLNYV